MKTKTVLKLLDDMVEQQIIKRGISDVRVLDAFRRVQRQLFVPKASQSEAFGDHPLDIGYGQTISQPYIVALMTESAKIEPTDRVLEIGTGSGYQTAILAELAREVYTIEINEDLYASAKKRLEKMRYANVHCMKGNGYYGWQEKSPFDKIIVSAAAYYLPSFLVDQLKEGGKLVVPLDTRSWQELYAITKERYGLKREKLCNCRFVPMVER